MCYLQLQSLKFEIPDTYSYSQLFIANAYPGSIKEEIGASPKKSDYNFVVCWDEDRLQARNDVTSHPVTVLFLVGDE